MSNRRRSWTPQGNKKGHIYYVVTDVLHITKTFRPQQICDDLEMISWYIFCCMLRKLSKMSIKYFHSLSRFQLNTRTKRSAMASSKSIGCVLVTCSYQDLLHRLHMFNDKSKEATAPGEKMGSKGYGRRRRSLLDSTQLGPRTERRRWIIGAGRGGRRRQTPPRAAWDGDEAAEEDPYGGFLHGADEDESPKRFYSIALLSGMQREWLLSLYGPSEETYQTIVDERLSARMLRWRLQFQQVCDLWMNSHQTCGTWQKCLSLLPFPRWAWQQREETILDELLPIRHRPRRNPGQAGRVFFSNFWNYWTVTHRFLIKELDGVNYSWSAFVMSLNIIKENQFVYREIYEVSLPYI